MSKVSVRYIIDDVSAAMRFYTTLLGFTVERDASPAFASVVRHFSLGIEICEWRRGITWTRSIAGDMR